MALEKNQEEHSNNLSWRGFDVIWDNLSNFWDNMPGREYLTIVWKAWDALVNPLKYYIRRKSLDHSIFSESYNKRNIYAVPIKLTFPLSSESHSFYVNSEFANITVLTDYINSPENILRSSNGDFTFARGDTDSDRGIITFSSESYSNSMWVTQYKLKKINEIVGRFGVFVDFDRKTKYETKTIEEILGLMMAQQLGPTIPRLEAGVNIINEWPYSPAGGTASSVNDSRIVVRKDAGGSSFIYNNIDLDFEHREDGDGDLVDTTEGSVIIEYSPLTKAVRFDDVITMPDMHSRFPISYYERWHTFLVRFDEGLPDTTSFVDATTSEVTYDIDWDWSQRFVERNKPVGAKPYYMVYINARPTSGVSATSYVDLPAPTCGIITSWTEFNELPPTCGILTNYNIELNIPINGVFTTFGIDIDTIPAASILLTAFVNFSGFDIITGVESSLEDGGDVIIYLDEAAELEEFSELGV